MGIFVSYTTRDSYINRELLEGVALILSEYDSHYIDLLHNDSSDKQQYVELMLSKADFILLITSDSIGRSEWVQWELSEARRSSIPIITVQASYSKVETLCNLKAKMISEFSK